jgi:ABC-type transport system involved in multi-copper enzyme maturation permease subunit
MTAKTTRILKEARPLFWPWCALIAAGMLPLARPLDPIYRISPVVFLLGIPLLASLPMGNEFQHQTLSLLLSQPVDRMEMWGEKMSVTAIAVLSAVLVFYVSSWAGGVQSYRPNAVSIGAWIVASVASATFWTFFTKSALGSVAITIAVQGFIVSAGDMVYRASWGLTPVLSAVLLLCYAGVMFWLGRRTFARFQVTGATAGDDLLNAGPDVMPVALAGWLRSRPTSAALNLIRKELRLLRPVWLLTLLTTIGWIGLTAYGLTHERGQTKPFTIRIASAHYPAVVWLVGVFSVLLVAILAGSLSLGEERTSGTHAWHMTLPVSGLRQWLLKLFMALAAGAIGAVLIPMLLLIAGGSLAGSPFMFVDLTFGKVWLLMVLLLSFAAFWCACAANGTMRAVLWVLPAQITIGLANMLGERAGRELVHALVARFDPFATFRFATTVSRLGSNAFFRLIEAVSENMTGSLQAGRMVTTIILVPTLVLAVIQSYRLFRTQLQDRALTVARSLLPLAMTAFLCSFSVLAYYTFVVDAMQPANMVFLVTRSTIWQTLRERAITKTLPSTASPNGTEALQLTLDDVAVTKAWPFPLSESTRRLLRNTRITVMPDKAHPGGFFCEEAPWKSTRCYYSATIHLTDGTDLIESFEPGDAKFPFGRFSGYVHWPGTAGQEPLRIW